MRDIRWTDKVYLDNQGNIRTVDGCPTNQMLEPYVNYIKITACLAQPIEKGDKK